MTLSELYNTAPEQDCFEDLQASIAAVYYESGLHKDYIKEKTKDIWKVVNIRDNFMFMLSKLDHKNIAKALSKCDACTTIEALVRLEPKTYKYYLNNGDNASCTRIIVKKINTQTVFYRLFKNLKEQYMCLAPIKRDAKDVFKRQLDAIFNHIDKLEEERDRYEL